MLKETRAARRTLVRVYCVPGTVLRATEDTETSRILPLLWGISGHPLLKHRQPVLTGSGRP